MRLIDADKLLARYKERCAGCKFTPNHCEHFCDIADVISDLEDAPTIEERKKGKWIDRGYMKVGFSCSLCGAYVISGKENYCHNCGADMGEGQNDEVR